MTDRLVPLTARTDAESVRAVTDALRRALDDAGPAVVPVPDGPAGAAVLTMAQLDVPLERGADGQRVALVVPTSGSTGPPKGAMLTASALRAAAAATAGRLGGPGQWLLALPLTHIAGLQVLIRSFLADTDPVAVPLGEGFDPAVFAAATRRLDGGRRYTSVVPTQLRRLLEGPQAGVEALMGYDAVLVGGAALDDALHRRAVERGVRVVTTYGMSETCGGCVYDGVPLDGVAVEAPDEEPVRLGGPVVFTGYRLRPDLTAAALRIRDGVRWHVSADRGHLDSAGRLQILGRVDDVIVTGGENVVPALVEAALARHPAVRDVVVVGLPDVEWGERVVAVVVPTPGDPPDLPTLRAHASTTLPPAAQPRQVHLVEGLPVLPSGKPDRVAIRRALSDPAGPGDAG